MITKGTWTVTEYEGCLHCRVGAVETTEYGESDVHIAYVGGAKESKANAQIIVTAVNQCKGVNPDNPQAVAESIVEAFEALKYLVDEGTKALEVHGWHGTKIDWERIVSEADRKARHVLAKARRK